MKIYQVEYALLSILMMLYIVFGIHTPVIVSQLMHNGTGPFLIILLIAYIYYKYDVYLTLLAIITGGVLIVRSTTSFISNIPGMTKSQQYDFYNEIPVDTLEQDMVKLRVPNSQYKDTPDDLPGSFVSSDVESTLPIYTMV